MDDKLKELDQEYIRYILDEIEYSVPRCHPDYGWEYEHLSDVIENGLSVSISIPSYNQWISQKNRDKKLAELGIK